MVRDAWNMLPGAAVTEETCRLVHVYEKSSSFVVAMPAGRSCSATDIVLAVQKPVESAFDGKSPIEYQVWAGFVSSAWQTPLARHMPFGHEFPHTGSLVHEEPPPRPFWLLITPRFSVPMTIWAVLS